jgi:predicted secreted protein
MGWFNGCVLFVLIWWTVLFAVLPFGTQPVATPDEHTGWRGAPAQARIGRKLLITTVVSLLVWAAVAAVILSGLVSFRSGFLAMPKD